MTEDRAAEVHAGEPCIDGSAILHRRGHPLWHGFELVADGQVVAELGRRSWLWIFLGPGQRVLLADGARGRIAARAKGRYIAPVVLDRQRRVVGRALPGPGGTYGINAARSGYRLVPHSANTWRRRSNVWELRRHDLVVADLTLSPSRITTAEPVPISVVLLAFTVMELGIPGEEDLGLRSHGW